jgi:F0F1-type ATP synthase membrane subunit c/vacuolar-type H+-ATPase subunit K
MTGIFYKYPLSIFVAAFALQCGAAFLGDLARRRSAAIKDTTQKDFGTILPAALTLLALIIGFSFSMAASRYDLRKTLEEAEANAIGTEYVRADLLPAAQAAQLRELLVDYTKQRILFYELRDATRLAQLANERAALQDQLWDVVTAPALATPTPVSALVVAGMNDVLNSQGYTQAAWWNRLPVGAWELLILVAFASNFLFGYSERRENRLTLMLLPLIISVPIFLIADIDTPRGGLIHVAPQNLEALMAGFPPN